MSHSARFAAARAKALERANQSVARAEAANILSRRQALGAEQARAGLVGLLGSDQTSPTSLSEFQQVTARQGEPGTTVPTPDIYTRQTAGAMAGREFPIAGYVTSDVLNPNKAINYYKETPTFQYLSAKQRQLMEGSLYQKGPLYNRMKESIQGPILESAAALRRETDQMLYRNTAAQGEVRTREMNKINAIRVAEDIARQKQQNLWQSSLALQQYVDQAAQQQIAFNTAWVNNLGGIRDTFTQTFINLNEYFTSIVPDEIAISGMAIESAYRQFLYEEQKKQRKKAKKKALLSIAIGIGAMALGGLGLWAAGAGVLGAGLASAVGTVGKFIAGVGSAITASGLSGVSGKNISLPPLSDLGFGRKQVESEIQQPSSQRLQPVSTDFGNDFTIPQMQSPTSSLLLPGTAPAGPIGPSSAAPGRLLASTGGGLTGGGLGLISPTSFTNVSNISRAELSPWLKSLGIG